MSVLAGVGGERLEHLLEHAPWAPPVERADHERAMGEPTELLDEHRREIRLGAQIDRGGASGGVHEVAEGHRDVDHSESVGDGDLAAMELQQAVTRIPSRDILNSVGSKRAKVPQTRR